MNGIILVSHTRGMVEGLRALLLEVAGDIPITIAGGTDEGDVGTSFEKIQNAINENPADMIYAFHDLGSAKLNLDMAIEMSDKTIEITNAAFVEGAYVVASLIGAGADQDTIKKNLDPIRIKNT